MSEPVNKESESRDKSLAINPERNKRFINAVARLYDLARREDLKIERPCDPSLPYFSTLSEADQLDVLSHLEATVRGSNEIIRINRSLRSSPLFTRSYIEHMGYRVPDELWDKIDDLDVIDVYGLDNRLKFACLRFLENLSYSLEELYCRHWMHLYYRERKDVLQAVSTAVEEIFLGHHDGVVDMRNVPIHIVVEIGSAQRLQLIDRPKYFSPVFKDRQVVAVLCVHRGAVVLKSQTH